MKNLDKMDEILEWSWGTLYIQASEGSLNRSYMHLHKSQTCDSLFILRISTLPQLRTSTWLAKRLKIKCLLSFFKNLQSELLFRTRKC